METLRRTGRGHALVFVNDVCTGMPAVRGIFSTTRLGQQLGISFEPVEVAGTFAEVEIAINVADRTQ